MQRIGNHEVDKFIQKTQLKAKRYRDVLEWIEYDRFENVEYLAKGGFGTIYKAIWKDGFIKSWDSENNKWIRSKAWFREIGAHNMIPDTEPKNAIDNKDDDNSFGEYSELIEAIDFTKLDLDKSN
ncbi:kinase-like domain-containing protein [Rhizophagus irregularis DAOM 181602=DAOM 197198]|nr:kinase-like domain-containing protein [Rhizophagus irregularis DAOM 181602=DAOM 197198]